MGPAELVNERMITPGVYEARRSLQARLLVLRAGLLACFGLLALGFWFV